MFEDIYPPSPRFPQILSLDLILSKSQTFKVSRDLWEFTHTWRTHRGVDCAGHVRRPCSGAEAAARSGGKQNISAQPGGGGEGGATCACAASFWN